MQIRRGHSRKVAAFSLIELLVVLAVIALLAGLLFPSLAASKEKARQTTCASNLHQIGLAVTIYMDDYQQMPPPRFQALVDAGYLRTPALLLCPDDPTQNWGGLAVEQLRRPDAPPETIRYSYLHPFGWPDWQVRYLLGSGGPSAGIAACQLHGTKTGDFSILAYQGTVLRLQRDGAVVRRRILWPHGADGVRTAAPWRFFSDAPPVDSEDQVR